MTWRNLALLTCALTFTTSAFGASPAAPLLSKIKAVGAEGEGNAEAGKAWQELVRLGPDVLLETLAAMDDANPKAANWLRTAVDAIAEQAVASGKPPESAKLEAFVRDTRHTGRSRYLAYSWLAKIDRAAPERLLPKMMEDPGVEMRREAIARAFDQAKKVSDKEQASEQYRKVFAAARDKDQVDAAAKELKALGVNVDLPAKYGFITRWRLIGPFDNHEKVGFARAYPPEAKVDLKAPYEGKESKQLQWIEHTTTDTYGTVDLNKALGKNMGAVGYAFAAVESAGEQPVEIRVGSNNAVKIFLNGKQLYFRDEYHHGNRMDQHVGRGTLKPGRNEVLLKVCQNEQKDNWAQSWGFQLRLCDALGGAVTVKPLAE
jgi:hypothetical protein